MRETVYALASGHGRAGVAVVRVSGPGAGVACARLTTKTLPRPRRASLAILSHPVTEEILDEALVMWFPAPASFTGEDVVEFHIHGGIAVIEGVLEALSTVEGLRGAEPGEFTRRAFLNGKLDLTQVEGLADLIAAETEGQRRQALRQTEGALGRLYEGWRTRLVRALAHYEAVLDFSDEELPQDVQETVVGEVRHLHALVGDHLKGGRQGERVRDGIRLAIIGPPNAGKSSLMNVLAQREAAIVSNQAGTTRDVVEVHLNMGGYAVLVADTAGLRPSADVLEAEGVRRAKAWAEGADLKLALFDGESLPAFDAETLSLVDAQTIVAVNKVDMVEQALHDIPQAIDGYPILSLSVKSGVGLEALLAQVTARVVERCQTQTVGPTPTRARHREALMRTEQALGRFLDSDQTQLRGSELEAEDLRRAARELGRITGRVDVEDLLDVIFRDFCIGK